MRALEWNSAGNGYFSKNSLLMPIRKKISKRIHVGGVLNRRENQCQMHARHKEFDQDYVFQFAIEKKITFSNAVENITSFVVFKLGYN